VYDDTCALHLHIGNIPRTKEFILAFFKMTMYIQDDIFQMFPLYKKYNFKLKNKNYSKPYPTYDLLSKMDSSIKNNNIDYNFNVLFEYLTEGVSFSEYDNDLNNVHSHPSDTNGNQKWNIKKRYHIHNLIPLIFGNKTTIEFRIHTPTYDMTKISMFLLLNTILVDYTKLKQDKILKNNSLHPIYDKNKIISIIKEYCNMLNISYKYSIYHKLAIYIECRNNSSEVLNKQFGVMYSEEKHVNLKPTILWDLSEELTIKPSTFSFSDISDAILQVNTSILNMSSQDQD
jgi:hypothetical protein